MKALPPRLSVALFPDSCAFFPIRARYSRFVRAIPDSCELFPLEKEGKLPSGANRSTPWGESLHPPGLNWSESLQRRTASSRFVREFPDSCALRDLARGVHDFRGMSRAARSVATGAIGATEATVRGRLHRTRLRGFLFPFNSLSIPLKEILS